jgi:predicted alpha/beta hydrolase family esterase
MKTRAILIPGNGNGTPQDNWFPYLERELPKLGLTVINRQFPDPELARAEFWLPFLEKLGADEQAILIGHSSGAIAALRYAETHAILGSVLVGAYISDLGYESEKASHYFDVPWDWEAIKRNQRWILQFSSTDDPFIPIEEPRTLHEKLGTDYHEFTDRQHFGHGGFAQLEFPELVEAVREKLRP